MSTDNNCYECAICDNKTFSDKSQWKRHTKNHMNPIKIIFQCLNCPESFTTKNRLIKHTTNSHNLLHKSCQTTLNDDNNDDDYSFGMDMLDYHTDELTDEALILANNKSNQIKEENNFEKLCEATLNDQDSDNSLGFKNEIIDFHTDELTNEALILPNSIGKQNNEEDNIEKLCQTTLKDEDNGGDYDYNLGKEILDYQTVELTDEALILAKSSSNHIKEENNFEKLCRATLNDEDSDYSLGIQIDEAFNTYKQNNDEDNFNVRPNDVIKSIDRLPSPKPIDSKQACTCVKCGTTINDLIALSLKEIQLKFKETKKISCNICGRIFKNVMKFNRHQLNHYKCPKTCAICLNCLRQHRSDQLSRYFDKAKPNSSRYIDRRVYSCSICHEQVIGNIKFQGHKGNHIRKDRRHKGLMPPPKKPPTSDDMDQKFNYECDICGKHLNCSKKKLQYHMLQHKYRQMIVSCEICDKSLQQTSLKKHMLSYHNNGPGNFVCELCGSAFKFNHRLANHVRVKHTREQRYECSVCQRRFITLEQLVRHQSVHTGERPLKCDKCEKTYRDATDLRRHKRIHGGVLKSHACDMCDDRFYEPKQLRKHKLSVHNIIV